LTGSVTDIVEIEGHLIDTLMLGRLLDVISSHDAEYQILEFDVGATSPDLSRARVQVTTGASDAMEALIAELQVCGANRVELGTAETVACSQDGVLPAGFYSTTNLPTSVWIEERRLEVENPEMDCAIVILPGSRARTVPMHRVRLGDQIVVGHHGVRVDLPNKNEALGAFEFMNSEVSPEKPKRLLVSQVAQRIRMIKRGEHPSGAQKVLAVCGPAVVHTGAASALGRLIREGWIDLLFAGNGFATHDIESNVMGTSLGISVREGIGTEGGHSNHLRVINEVRRYGSIAAAVDAGYIEAGVMYECVKNQIPFVLGGSVRDDGPLPDVTCNVVDAADAMRYFVPEIACALMLSTTLHAIATGNLLPAAVDTYCVDINQSVVTKLGDRGSHQAVGIVTDVGLFVHALANELVGGDG